MTLRKANKKRKRDEPNRKQRWNNERERIKWIEVRQNVEQTRNSIFYYFPSI